MAVLSTLKFSDVQSIKGAEIKKLNYEAFGSMPPNKIKNDQITQQHETINTNTGIFFNWQLTPEPVEKEVKPEEREDEIIVMLPSTSTEHRLTMHGREWVVAADEKNEVSFNPNQFFPNASLAPKPSYNPEITSQGKLEQLRFKTF